MRLIVLPPHVGTVTASNSGVTKDAGAAMIHADVAVVDTVGAWTGATVKSSNTGASQDACKLATVAPCEVRPGRCGLLPTALNGTQGARLRRGRRCRLWPGADFCHFHRRYHAAPVQRGQSVASVVAAAASRRHAP